MNSLANTYYNIIFLHNYVLHFDALVCYRGGARSSTHSIVQDLESGILFMQLAGVLPAALMETMSRNLNLPSFPSPLVLL